MRNNVKWENSEFSKEKKVNNFEEIWDEDYSGREFHYEGMPVESTSSMEITAEDTTDDIKLWLIDIHEEWGDNADKLIRIRKIYLDMNTTDKVLYDLYFTNMMSTRMIAKKLNIPSSSVHVMLTDLKNKIKVLCGTSSIK
jgi:DNA-directed RNA polymerase specialized sigma subunit